MRGPRFTLLLLPVVLGCHPKEPGDSSGQDSEPPFIYRDTGAVVETGDPETAAPDDSGPVDDTGDTGGVEPTITGLELFPGSLAVFPGAAWSLRVVAEGDDGERADVFPEQVTFTSSDEHVVAVDAAGLASAMAEGEATLAAAFGGREAWVAVEVIPAGYAEITVIDVASGAALAGAWGSTPDSARTTGDAAGLVRVPIEEPGPATFTAWTSEHVPLSVVGTVDRRVVLPLRTLASVHERGVEVAGAVDLTGVDPGAYNDVIVGLAAATIQVHPLCFDLPNLIAEDREVTVWGVDAVLPGNLFVHNAVEDWQGHAAAGDFGVWSLAGAVPIADITAALSGDTGVLDLLMENLDAFAYGFTGGYSGADGEAVVAPVAPSVPLSEPVQVSVPELSLGFSGDEVPLVFVTDRAADGSWAVTGLGWGTGEQVAQRAPLGSVPPGDESWALAVAQVGGLGSGSAMALSAAPVAGGAAAPPAFQTIPVIASFSPETQEYSFSTDPRATLVRVTLAGRHGDVWDLYFPGGEQQGVLHQPQGYGFDFGRTSWTLTAVELWGDTFDGLVGRGSLTDEALAPRAATATREIANFAE
ncbi:MAG: hypothetical protein ABIO70_32675 [Pseudomonadota bacterium]